MPPTALSTPKNTETNYESYTIELHDRMRLMIAGATEHQSQNGGRREEKTRVNYPARGKRLAKNNSTVSVTAFLLLK